MKTTKLVIEFDRATVTWNINSECRKAVGPIAKVFKMTVPEFLEAKTRKTLPGQLEFGHTSWTDMTPPKGFSVTVGDSVWEQLIEEAARYEKRTPTEEAWRAIAGYLECIYSDTIRHPKTLKIICEKSEFDEFRTHEMKRSMAA